MLSFDFQSVRIILPYSDNVKHTEEARADPGLINTCLISLKRGQYLVDAIYVTKICVL